MEKKTWKKTLCALLAAILLLAAMPLAGAEEPHGDGNGILSRPLLASLYKWLDGMDGNFRALLTFDEISNAVGKWGCLKEKSGEDTHAAYWTDGEDYVTVTFRNRNGYWGVTSIVTDLPREEYMAADASFLPPVGNREAGSSPAEPVTMGTKVKPSGEEASVTVQLPAENWFAKESFGELRYLNAPDESKVSGNSSGLRLSFWSDADALRAEQEKGAENLADTESLYILGMEMKGTTYTKYGMDMTDYTAQLGENLFLRMSVYQMDIYPGSEAEAIVRSLSVQCGDFSFSYEPLGWDDDPGEGPVPGGTAFSMDYITGSKWAADGVIRLEERPRTVMVFNNYSIEDLAFSHAMESDKWYSYVDFDICIADAETEQPLPMLRMWVTMVTKESYMDITSVTFTTGGRDYTFSGLSDEEDFMDREGDFQQDMLILFDDNSMSFLYDLEISRLLGEETFKAVFHGSRDIEAEIGPNFWDIFSVYWDLYQNSGAAECLDGFEGTEMTSELAY